MMHIIGLPRHLILLLLAAVLLVPQVSAANSPIAHITDIAWETEGQVGKVIIQLDGPVAYRTEASAASIVVDLWQARHAQWRVPTVTHPYVRSVRINQITDDLARVRIDLLRPARYKTFLNEESHTLIIVVIPPWMATSPLPNSVAYERQRVRTGAGMTTAHVLLVNPEDQTLEIRPALAADMVSGFETTSVIATRYEALAGVNGGYFGTASGMPLGMVVIDGQLMTTPTDRRSVFVITREGKPAIVPFEFTGRVVTAGRTSLWVSGVNHPPHAGGLAVFTRFYGPLTPPLQMAAVVRNDVVEHLTSGKILIPQDGYVLGVNAGDADLITKFIRVGDRLWLRLDLSPDIEITSAVGGGPRLVKDGQAFVPFAWEWFSQRHAQERAPRTAVGITATNKVLLVTVDGRSGRQNTGMTLREMAELMVQLGARDAMNLDGGSSATMVVGGRVVNDPSDGMERPIASALLVLHRPEATAPAIRTTTRTKPLNPPVRNWDLDDLDPPDPTRSYPSQ
jgi:exopolysaccharide biosynthesis protein